MSQSRALTGRKLQATLAEWVGARRYSSQGSDQSGGWAAPQTRAQEELHTQFVHFLSAVPGIIHALSLER